MNTKEISVNVSKKIGRTGTFGSDMVSASITVSVDDESEVKSAFVESWAKAWEEVDKQEHEIQDRKEMEESVRETIKSNEEWINEPSVPPTYSAPVQENTGNVCPIHKVALVWKPAGVSKKTNRPYPGFYSCPGRNPDGSFCSFHPK